MISHPRKKIDAIVDSRKLAKMRKNISKKIDEFKDALLDGLTMPKDSGPLHASLLPDPVEEKPKVILEEKVEPKIKFSKMKEEKLEFVPLVTPIKIERVDIPGVDYSVELPTSVTHPDPVPFSTPIHYDRNPQGRIFLSGIDNTVNSTVRTFLQKLGLQTFNAQSERHHSESIAEQFQIHSNKFDFAVVILSSDEVLTQKIQTLEQGLCVSRQETIFELGFLVGKLGKGKVAVFYEDIPKFKRPTEYFDLLYTEFDANGHWQKRLLNQLHNCGLIHETVGAT